VKGSNLVEVVKLLRRQRDRARAELAPTLHRYLEERVLVTSWYPEADLVAILRVAAKWIGTGSSDAFELMGRVAMRDHLRGVYERLLTGDPTTLPRRVGALWQSQHDTGRLSFHQTGPGRGHFHLEEFGDPSRELCAIICGYLHEGLVQGQFAEPRIWKAGCVLDGEKLCRWDCSWTEAKG
jgi:hypothetical protein